VVWQVTNAAAAAAACTAPLTMKALCKRQKQEASIQKSDMHAL